MRAARLAALAIAAVMAATGCDLFKPAEPEAPVGEALVGDYSSPERTLETVAQALEAKATRNGTDVYLKAFADPDLDAGRSFVATFDPATLLGYTGLVPNPWGIDEEQLFYNGATGSDGNSSWQMQWSSSDQLGDPTEVDTDTLRVRHRAYLLARVVNGASSAMAAGHARLRFIRNSRGWVIVRWEDHEDVDFGGATPSYGLLRLNNQ